MLWRNNLFPAVQCGYISFLFSKPNVFSYVHYVPASSFFYCHSQLGSILRITFPKENVFLKWSNLWQKRQAVIWHMKRKLERKTTKQLILAVANRSHSYLFYGLESLFYILYFRSSYRKAHIPVFITTCLMQLTNRRVLMIIAVCIFF
jgi:hypothetical protein